MSRIPGKFTNDSISCLWDLTGVTAEELEHFFETSYIIDLPFNRKELWNDFGFDVVVISTTYESLHGRWQFMRFINESPEVKEIIERELFFSKINRL